MSPVLPKIVNAKNARERLNAGALLVDVREPNEWEKTRVGGALLIPLGDVETRRDEIPKDRDVILICRSGRRSADAQATLERHGYDRVANLEGGILAWIDAGLPVLEGR